MRTLRALNHFTKVTAALGLIIVTLMVGSTSHAFERASALQDPQERISEMFSVPRGLEQRTAFWFDVYTLYGNNDHIVHHTLYPWLVYKVVNTRPIYELPLHKWTKYHRAEKFVKNEVAAVRHALKKMSKRGNKFVAKTDLEKQLVLVLSQVPGPRSRVYKEAFHNLRVQLGQKDFILAGLAHSQRYLAHMESIFSDRGLPTELTRLPFVESSFNVHAESKVGASGIWQIMPNTGRQYLLVNEKIDERNSPLKATLAAAEILRTNMRVLKAWPLAVTAYNHGPTGIRRALRAAKTDNLPELVAKYHAGSFKFASANFYTSFLAVLHAEKYHREIFKEELPSYALPLKLNVVALDRALRFKTLAHQLKVSKEELLTYNLDLKAAARSNALLPSGYKLIVPSRATSELGALKRPKTFREAALSIKSKTSG